MKCKYIDAEKLKRFVGELKAQAQRNCCDSWGIVPDALEEVEEFIESLQQEQPDGLHFTPLNRLIQKIPSETWNDSTNNYAKKLRDYLIKEGYRKDAEVLQGYISYMNGNNVPMVTMDEQEQPEVDFEKELKNERTKLLDAFGPMNGEQSLAIKNFARHFAKWGAEHLISSNKMIGDHVADDDKLDSSDSKIPNDLVEAAEEYAPDFSNSIASKAAVSAVRDAFKAGAEWVIGQLKEE